MILRVSNISPRLGLSWLNKTTWQAIGAFLVDNFAHKAADLLVTGLVDPGFCGEPQEPGHYMAVSTGQSRSISALR